jgi:hypothetical protein
VAAAMALFVTRRVWGSGPTGRRRHDGARRPGTVRPGLAVVSYVVLPAAVGLFASALLLERVSSAAARSCLGVSTRFGLGHEGCSGLDSSSIRCRECFPLMFGRRTRTLKEPRRSWPILTACVAVALRFGVWRPGNCAWSAPVGYVLAVHVLIARAPNDLTTALVSRGWGYAGILAVLPLAAAIGFVTVASVGWVTLPVPRPAWPPGSHEPWPGPRHRGRIQLRLRT